MPGELKATLNEFNVFVAFPLSSYIYYNTNENLPQIKLERRQNSQIKYGFVKVDLSVTPFIHILSMGHFVTNPGWTIWYLA